MASQARARKTGNDPNAKNVLYRPMEVAKMLRCSAWWIKEQARKRRIPFSWIGGSYRFTDEHVAEIVRLFESRPERSVPASPQTVHNGKVTRRSMGEVKVRLRARTPRRAARATRQESAEAA